MGYDKSSLQRRYALIRMTAEATKSDNNDQKEKQGEEESTFDFIIRRATELNRDYDTKTYVTKAQLAQQKKEWEEQCKLMREEAKKEDPIVKYCDDIRGVTPYYELSFEKMQELEAKNGEERKHNMNELLTNRFTDTKRSTKEERKQYRLEKKQQQKDRQLENITPIRIFERRVRKIGCECEGERIRIAGEYCDTCRLIVKVNEYMMNLFRNTAQGRA